MKVPDEQVLHKVKQWLIHGDEDLRLASFAMTFQGKEEPPYRLVAYHAQQVRIQVRSALEKLGVELPG